MRKNILSIRALLACQQPSRTAEEKNAFEKDRRKVCFSFMVPIKISFMVPIKILLSLETCSI